MKAIHFGGLALAIAACQAGSQPAGTGVETVESDLTAPNRIAIAAQVEVPGGTAVPLKDAENWVHWGLSGTSANRKANVTPQLARVFTKVGTGTISQYPESTSAYPHYYWNDGSPTTSADTKTGIKSTATGTGFQFSVPVTATPKRTRLYVTLLNAKATLQVKLSGATTVSSTLDHQSTTRKTFSIDVDIWSATTQEATVTLTFTQNYGSGFTVLHAAAILPLDLAFSNATHSFAITPPAGVPQPYLYGLNESFTSQPIPLANSHISLKARFTGGLRDVLFGGELWRDDAFLRETSTVSGNLVGFDFDEVIPGPHKYKVIGVSQFGARAASEEIPFHPRAYAFNESPAAIPDLQCVTKSLVISGASGTVSEKIDVAFSLDHTYPGDLKIDLITPFGTTATLVANLTAGGYGMVDTRISYRGGLPSINEAQPPYTGAYGPSVSFPYFGPQQVNGVWQVRVCDEALYDEGVLKYVRLYVLPDP